MTLSMKTYKGFNKLPYCEAHIPKAKATTVAKTLEMKRLAENTKIQSNVQYHADFEKNKAKFTQIADDPETMRIKQNTKIISNVSYHGDLEKKALMEMKRDSNAEEETPTVVSTGPVGTANNYHHHHHNLAQNPHQDANHNSPYSTGRNSQTLVYSSQTGPVQQPSTNRIGSIADYDPINEQYGSIAQQKRAQQHAHSTGQKRPGSRISG
ncbi:LIM and SH3 domain protein Lasp, partial [Armadillidium vulgare]